MLGTEQAIPQYAMIVNQKIDCLGYPVFSDTLERLSNEKKLLISTINQYSYCIAETDEEFKLALKGSDILLPDGIGIVMAAKFLNNRNIKKIAGADLHHSLLKKLNKNHGSCFYMGSSEETLTRIEMKIKLEYPNIRVGTHSPPFKDSFNEEETEIIIKHVNDFQPDVLFVGMTAPKQEKWAYHNKNRLNVQIICSIGAVFDFYAGTINRPHQLWISLGLEWLGRLVKEPRRMWRRYIYYGVIFGIYLGKEKIRLLGKQENTK